MVNNPGLDTVQERIEQSNYTSHVTSPSTIQALPTCSDHDQILLNCNMIKSLLLKLAKSSKSSYSLPAVHKFWFPCVTCDQEDLNNPASWAQKNQRSFSTKKCKLLQITCKWSPISAPLLPDGTPLVTEFSDLELLTNYKLSWNSHIDKIASKANKVLGLIERNCRDLRDISMLRTRYCTLVRPQLKFYGHPSLPEIFWSWKECNIELWSLS